MAEVDGFIYLNFTERKKYFLFQNEKLAERKAKHYNRYLLKAFDKYYPNNFLGWIVYGDKD